MIGQEEQVPKATGPATPVPGMWQVPINALPMSRVRERTLWGFNAKGDLCYLRQGAHTPQPPYPETGRGIWDQG
jgi:hypothetical protein